MVIGHNADIAWGMTNLGPDVTDFYLEDVADDTYLCDGKQEPVETREETIKVAGGNDVPLTVRSTEHGPLVSDVLDDRRPRPGAEAPAPEPGAVSPERVRRLAGLDRADPGPDGRRGLRARTRPRTGTSSGRRQSCSRCPSQNLVYADTDGNIGYQAPGQDPGPASRERPRPGRRHLAAPGWDSD